MAKPSKNNVASNVEITPDTATNGGASSAASTTVADAPNVPTKAKGTKLKKDGTPRKEREAKAMFEAFVTNDHGAILTRRTPKGGFTTREELDAYLSEHPPAVGEHVVIGRMDEARTARAPKRTIASVILD